MALDLIFQRACQNILWYISSSSGCSALPGEVRRYSDLVGEGPACELVRWSYFRCETYKDEIKTHRTWIWVFPWKWVTMDWCDTRSLWSLKHWNKAQFGSNETYKDEIRTHRIWILSVSLEWVTMGMVWHWITVKSKHWNKALSYWPFARKLFCLCCLSWLVPLTSGSCLGEGLEVIDDFISFYSRTLTTTLLTDDGKSFLGHLDTGQKFTR